MFHKKVTVVSVFWKIFVFEVHLKNGHVMFVIKLEINEFRRKNILLCFLQCFGTIKLYSTIQTSKSANVIIKAKQLVFIKNSKKALG